MNETNAAVTNSLNEAASTVVSAPSFWSSYGSTVIWVCIIGAAFAWLWYKGYLAQFANYVQLTREELRKCTWPTWTELKGSTVVIFISIALMGGFTIVVDFIFRQVMLVLT